MKSYLFLAFPDLDQVKDPQAWNEAISLAEVFSTAVADPNFDAFGLWKCLSSERGALESLPPIQHPSERQVRDVSGCVRGC